MVPSKSTMLCSLPNQIQFKVNLLLYNTLAFNVSTDGIIFTIPDNALYYSTAKTSTSVSSASQNLYVTISLRDCEAGEALLSSGKCSDCAFGTYLLTSPTDIISCKEC